MKSTRKNLIYDVLRNFKTGLHVRDIATEIIKKGFEKDITEEQLMSKISNVLSNDIRKNKIKSNFRKIPNNKGGYKQGFYKIKRVKKPMIDIAIEKMGERKISDIKLPDVSTLYTGKAGEYAVLSELLFYGFNASLMSVDEGIDIVASKNDKYFHIQVKTTNIKNGNFYASISKNQFEKFKASAFYILVLRYPLSAKIRSDFVVFRSSDIERFIETGIIKNANTLGLNIKIENKKIILNNREDIKFYLNKFSFIA